MPASSASCSPASTTAAIRSYVLPGILYSAYAIAVLVVAAGGLLAVVFGTPDIEGRTDYRYGVLAIVATVFIVAMIGDFIL